MHTSIRNLLLIAFVICGISAKAQLPNEKFGKPSNLEWDFVGWGDALDADAIILCKTMKVTYQLSDQVANYNQSSTDISADNFTDFSNNHIDEGNILVKYEFKLRTKVLKPEGAKHANIDITYFNAVDEIAIHADDLSDLKIRVFTKNGKGKVEKRNVDTSAFTQERLDDNYMVMHVTVPDVEAGSIIEYQYNITSTRHTFLYDWVFQECIPTVRSKCDIDIPAFLQFNMNVPINKLIQSNVEAGRLTYDANRSDMKRSKTCITNHYTITGNYILPEGHTIKQKQANAEGKTTAQEKIADFTSKIVTPNTPLPVYPPEGSTHLRVK